MVTVPKAEIYDLSLRAFKNAGLADEETVKIIFDHLLENELSGKKSHGLLRVKRAIDHMKKKGTPSGKPTLALDAGALAIVDGQNNIGVVAAKYAVDCAIEKAKTYGISMVGARNHFATTGTMNYYNRLFVEAGLIGIAGCNSEAMVSHPDGLDPVIGTNPISFGIPSAKTPCIIDVTTAQWAYGKLLEMQKAGEPMPKDAMIDKDGNPSTDIKDAFDGTMLPMNGFRGFSIGLAIEILGGALIGGKLGHSAVQGSDGIFFIAIDPDKTVGRDVFESQVEAFLQEVKSSRTKASVEEILIPGERSQRAFDANNIDIIVINETVHNDLKELAA